MALVECHECGNQISNEAKRCPQCGATNKHRKKPRILRWILLFIAIALVAGFVLLEVATSPNFCESYLGRHTFIGVFDRSIDAKRKNLRVVDVTSQKELSRGDGQLEDIMCEFEFKTNDSNTMTFTLGFVPAKTAGVLVVIKQK